MNAAAATVAADGAGIALDARAFAQVVALSQALAVSVDIDETLKEAVLRIADCMQAEAASVFLLDTATGRLVCRACAGPVDVLGLSLPADTGIVGRSFVTASAQLVRDAQRDPDFAGKVDGKTGFCTRSVLAAPLVTARGVIGVIEVLNKRDGGLFADGERDVLRLLAAPAALAISNAALVAEMVDQTRIRRELQLARRMQRSLLPRRRRDGFPLLGVNRPAREISGDFYDWFDLPDGRIAFTIGDIAGKGLDAALLMVRCASLLRWAGKDGLAPAAWLTAVNEELADTLSGGMFVCAVVGHYDPATRHATWANAGFPPALLHDHDGSFREYEAEGPPLGILPGMVYTEQSAHVARSLYFFSDGVTDVRGRDRELLGLAGVRALIERHADPAPEHRLKNLVGELRRLRLADDTTILLVEGRGP